MCGIIGIIDKKRQFSPQRRKVLMQEMLSDIAYRGHDSTGIYEKGGLVMGHNRLAIIDTSGKATQPMFTNDGRLVISYNGEIFNHLELRDKRLMYATHSDTESLLISYKQKGEQIFESIRGMFAVSLYEPEKNKILLAVDSFGIKPLYYLNTEDWFAWASEPKVFKRLSVNFTVKETLLYEYGIFRTICGQETLISSIYKLLPSQIIEYNIEDGNIRTSNYKYLDKEVDKDIDKLLFKSINEHILSDVPIGFQLSGGVDSGLISVIAQKFLNQKEIHSFSIGLEDPEWNEFKYSREIARILKTQHHEIIFNEKDFCENYPIATYHLDEPIAYPNTVPIMLLSREAAKHTKVLLSGEGADELFGGYKRYTKLVASKKNDSQSILYSNRYSTPDAIRDCFKIGQFDLADRLNVIDSLTTATLMQKLSFYDLKTFLPSLLLRQDKVGMSCTLENRFPFLDPRLANAALALPDYEKNDGTNNKIRLKTIAHKYLPEKIVSREKCGFGLPISAWLRNEKGLGKYLQLLTKSKSARPYLNYPYIKKLISDHLQGNVDNSETIWILLSLELWARIFIDGKEPHNIWASLKT